MAGVMPTKRSSGRKQWTIHDGPRGSLKRLRSQLASDGCAESQVVLAKQLLEEQCELDVEKNENARLGVYWLLKASEQGNTEATDLLKQCLKTGKGITEQNYMDVKTCINMTQDEKIARKAAREMFASLSNGEDYITSEQLQKRMLEIDKQSQLKEKPLEDFEDPNNVDLAENYQEQTSESEEETDWSQRSDGYNEKLTEDHVVAAAVDYSHGNLPLVNRILCLTEPNLRALDHIPFIQRSILHPFLAFRILYYKTIKVCGRKAFFKYFPILKTETQFFLVVLLYLFVSSDNFVFFLPMAVFYVSFIFMALTTFQMLQVKRDYSDYRVWTRLFLTYSGGSLNSNRVEFQFICNNLRPFGHFFVSLLVNMSVHPIISNQWLPYSELTIISFCLTFMTLFSFTFRERKRHLDLLLFLSFSVNVVARYPYETDAVVTQGWRFLELNVPNFASYVIGNSVEFCINFRVLFYLFIPFLLLIIARQENWRGIYKFLIPHCVTLSWLQMVIVNSQGATMYGLLRATLALVGVVLFLPLAGVTSIVLPAAALTKYLLTCNSLYNVAMFVGFSAVGLSLSFILAKSRFNKCTALLQVALGIVAFIVLMNSVIHEKSISINTFSEKHVPSSISWEQYQNYCYETSWESQNVASTQIKCAKLASFLVDWEGYVSEIMITEINNSYKNIIDKFPRSIRTFLYCYFGDQMQHECDKVSQTLEDDCLIFYDIIKSKLPCHLDKYNVYQFQIDVRMPTGIWGKATTISLLLNNDFKNFTMELMPDDKIKFKGELASFLGKRNVIVNVNEIECLSCQNPNLSKISLNCHNLPLNYFSNLINIGIKDVLNFILKPFVIFK
ncbi:wolframin [Agrilus planipennis]|uniref:Wolframin n=1 Tax=Agrilus planipennis TaxID=224129 RepID=A0A7F5REU6_AGRPL|nr:wolframin [Agrilus planipennis]